MVRSLARRYIHIRRYSKSGNAMICSYWDDMSRVDVTDRDISFAVQGTWSSESTTFLEYIQNQLLTLTEEMNSKMSQIKTFTNMEGTSRKEDLRHLMNMKVTSKKR